VIPNLLFRESDAELFEDNPREYIRRDVEGSDTDTRRRAALELVRGLRKNYEQQVTQFFAADVAKLLAQYAASPSSEEGWRAKDAAITLITAVAVKTASAAQGATAVNELVPVAEFYRNHILTELQQGSTAHPVIRADCIKFMTTFRRMLAATADGAKMLVTTLVRALDDDNFVVRTYAATGIERLLAIRDAAGFRFDKAFLHEFAMPLLIGLFKFLDGRDEVSQENEYVMRAVLRVLAVLRESAAPLSSELFGKFISILKAVAQNPRNPVFNHYLFESIACMFKSVITFQPAALKAVETLFLPVFQEILVRDVTDFVPYVFQLMALLIELSPPGPQGMSQAYRALFPSLLVPVLWERSGSVPALSRLIQSFVRHAGEAELMAAGHATTVLGIFQRLVGYAHAVHADGVPHLLCTTSGMPCTQTAPRVRHVAFAPAPQARLCAGGRVGRRSPAAGAREHL
jgi:exportin-2 (importin alpha re-exporter)